MTNLMLDILQVDSSSSVSSVSFVQHLSSITLLICRYSQMPYLTGHLSSVSPVLNS